MNPVTPPPNNQAREELRRKLEAFRLGDNSLFNDDELDRLIALFTAHNDALYAAVMEWHAAYSAQKSMLVKVGHSSVEAELDSIMEDLAVGHNFDYARKAILEWHAAHSGPQEAMIHSNDLKTGLDETPERTNSENTGNPGKNENTESAQQQAVTGETSDGWHTFNELYEYRMLYNAALFNEWTKDGPVYDVHKSWRHSDGEACFGGGWFVVVAQLPTGQISNHYEAKHWDLFKIPERDFADKWDGHTPQDVAKRLRAFLNVGADHEE